VAIAEKSRVNELVVTDGTDALLELLGLLAAGAPLLPHAAMTRAALPASAVRPTLLVAGFTKPPRSWADVTGHAPVQFPHDGHRGPDPVDVNSKPLSVNGVVNIGVTLLINY
jgi:hypothetical protein